MFWTSTASSAPPWETPELIEINRLPMHATFQPYATVRSALRGDPRTSRWVQFLNGTWKLRVVRHPGLLAPHHVKDRLRTGRWRDIEVPANWNLHGFGKPPQYTNVAMPFDNDPPHVPREDNPTGIYRTQFRMPAAWAGRRTIIHFGGVESCFLLYCNGAFVGMSKDSRLPAEFDLTPFVREGDNTLAVLCLQYSDASYLEDQDHWWMAGIFRDVYLYSTPAVFIDDIRVAADFDPAAGGGHLQITVTLGGRTEPEKTAHAIRVQLYDNRTPLWSQPLRARVTRDDRPPHHAVHLERSLRPVKPWNPEVPHLYTAVCTLTTASGALLQHVPVRVGFRRVAIANRQFLLNGQPVYIKGVNHHDHDPDHGKAVRRAWMERDIVLMKQNNLNALRTSHYPADPALYDLCDRYGILVVDEANLENHANYPTLCRDPRWRRAYVERITRMVQRDRNHPCIVAWSLGNESGYGEHHDAAADIVRRLDPTRPLHNEGAVKPGWSQRGPNQYGAGGERSNDMINPMYPRVTELIEWARTPRERRPFIMCEYCSTTGNSGGCMKEYWDAIYAYHGLQGGFIWQWADHALRRRDRAGRVDWAYGGDFGEPVHDFNFHCNGLVSPDRRPHPALHEYRKLVQPVAVHADDPKTYRFVLLNRDVYRSSDGLDASWRLAIDGRVRQRGYLCFKTPPGGRQKVTLPIRPFDTPPGARAVVTFSFRTRHKTDWCPRGHEVAWEQFVLASPPYVPPRARGRVSVRNEGRALSVTAGPTVLRVDRRTGHIASLTHAAQPVLCKGPVFNLWRAPIDNDGIRARPDHRVSPRRPLGRWLAAGYPKLRARTRSVHIETSDDRRLIVCATQAATPRGAAAGFTHEARYTFTGNGVLHCEHTFHVPPGVVDPPRLGVLFMLPAGFEDLEWVGRGPHESYPDRKAGARWGRYRAPVARQHHDYMVPQENGLKVDCRRFTVRGAHAAVRVTSCAPDGFAFSAHHYTPWELEQALHTHEVPSRPETVILIDAAHRGLGTAACGPDTLPQYTITPGAYMLAYDIRARTIT